MRLSTLLHWIENKTGAVACVQILHPLFLDSENLRLSPEQYLHHGEYCRAAKLNGFLDVCSKNKSRSIEIASNGRMFSGECPLGLLDLAFPVVLNGTLLAILYLGGFRGSLSEKILSCFHGELPPSCPAGKKAELRKYGAFVRDFILLEFELLMKSGALEGKKHDAEYYIKNTLFYIDCNFTENLSIEDPAETLGINPGYLGELLKKKCGKNFRDILNERRIRESEIYLKLHPALSVGEIAARCGFPDSNYFSTVFRRLKNVSPREFRRGEKN